MIFYILFWILVVSFVFSIMANKLKRQHELEMDGKNLELVKLRDANNKIQAENNLLMSKTESLKEGMLEKDAVLKDYQSFSDSSLSRISSLYADHLLIQYEISEKYLKNKKHPAFAEAKRINELRLESKMHIERYRQMVYKYEALLQLFPELRYYVDDFNSIKELENVLDLKSFQDDFDRALFYLDKDEYDRLSTDDRNQLALDRYINSRKTKWQIGRDYELFCGLIYENKGYEVEYFGMEQKLSDMWRDLIARKDKEHLIIQCKYWSEEKTIHEKHITQLFWTMVEYRISHPDNLDVKAVFITNINLSETAKRFARNLWVIVKEEVKIENFPRIKCNISRDEWWFSTRIYHLPFDQQYDRTKIRKHGEFYAYTVKEAVDSWFRRAYKHYQ